jgi:hypothetical protein
MLLFTLEDPAKKQKMIDDYKQSKKVIYLPNKSPIMKGVEPDDSDASESSLSSNENGIRYPSKPRPNVFQIRVFNGDLHETKDEAAN